MSTSLITSIRTTAMSSITMISSVSSAYIAIEAHEWLGDLRVALRSLGRRWGRRREGELVTAHLRVVIQLSIENEVTWSFILCFKNILSLNL